MWPVVALHLQSKASTRLGVAIVSLSLSPALTVGMARQVQKYVLTDGADGKN